MEIKYIPEEDFSKKYLVSLKNEIKEYMIELLNSMPKRPNQKVTNSFYDMIEVLNRKRLMITKILKYYD